MLEELSQRTAMRTHMAHGHRQECVEDLGEGIGGEGKWGTPVIVSVIKHLKSQT